MYIYSKSRAVIIEYIIYYTGGDVTNGYYAGPCCQRPESRHVVTTAHDINLMDRDIKSGYRLQYEFNGQLYNSH